MKIVDTKEYVSVLEKELTEQGHEVSVIVAGNSMSPFLMNNRDAVMVKKPEKPLKKGDIVLYQRKNGKYVLHRICGIRGGCYDIIGDAESLVERSVRREQIFAVVTRIRRKGKVIEAGDFWWEFFEHVWIRLIPVRRIVVRLYAKIRHKERELYGEEG